MAFVDSRQLTPDHLIEADLCVIGAGAAGLSIASRFFGTSTKVVLLESGGMELDAETQALYSGGSVGQLHTALDQSRLRFFGGTTNHWTAHVRPLDRQDFEQRAWVPHSGWPFERPELDPHYASAAGFLGLPGRAFEAGKSGEEQAPFHFDGTVLESRVRRVLPVEQRRLGELSKEQVSASTNVDVYLHANLLRIENDPERSISTGLSLGTLGGLRFRARAKRYVLAAGGIENARILMLSKIKSRGGSKLGAGDDLVGAFYANHPEYGGGYAISLAESVHESWFRRPQREGGVAENDLVLSREAQAEARLQNCTINLNQGFKLAAVKNLAAQRMPAQLRPARPRFPDRAVASLARGLGRLSDSDDSGRARRMKVLPIALKLIGEPAPRRDSRVRLSDRVDALGLRRAELDWRLGDSDLDSVRNSLRVLADAAGASGLARARSLLPEKGVSRLDLTGSHHHMGTTRMHRDPSQGVVDENCRVHGFANLYVAGSSVFPTYGAANPTLTIIALAFRLVDHLRREL